MNAIQRRKSVYLFLLFNFFCMFFLCSVYVAVLFVSSNEKNTELEFIIKFK